MKEMLQSKKFRVYGLAVVVIVASKYLGLGAAELDELTKITMAYMGGQGLADLGKYAGQHLGGFVKDIKNNA